MAASLSWLEQNWLNLLQTLGIIGSGLLTTAAFHRETRARKLGYFLSLAQQHRELWNEAHRRPELARIFQREADLVANPVSVAESEFLNLVIVHFHTGWLFAKDTAFLDHETIATDARTFFTLPLPLAVWNTTRAARDPKFIRFMEEAFGAEADGPASR